MATPAPRSSFQRELDKDLLWLDRNMAKVIAAVFAVAVFLAIATAEPGTPAAALAEVLQS